MASTTIPFRLASRRAPLITVDVKVNHEPLRFVFDTGASSCCIARDAAERIGLRPHRNREAAGAGGTFEVGVVRLGSISLGRYERRGLQAAVMDLQPIRQQIGIRIDGILGYNFFKKLVLTIDYPARKLRLREPPTP